MPRPLIPRRLAARCHLTASVASCQRHERIMRMITNHHEPSNWVSIGCPARSGTSIVGPPRRGLPSGRTPDAASEFDRRVGNRSPRSQFDTNIRAFGAEPSLNVRFFIKYLDSPVRGLASQGQSTRVPRRKKGCVFGRGSCSGSCSGKPVHTSDSAGFPTPGHAKEDPRKRAVVSVPTLAPEPCRTIPEASGSALRFSGGFWTANRGTTEGRAG